MYAGVNLDSTINMTRQHAWLNAADAARFLDISRATLYAYVSRGYIRSQATPGVHRVRTYAREDLERLRQQAEQRRAPEKAAARALDWGLPVLESAITLVDGRRLYYRGHDVALLARERSLRQVAALIWTGALGDPPAAAAPVASSRRPRDGAFISRAQAMLAAAAAADAGSFDLRAASVARTGWRIVQLVADAAAPTQRRLARVEEQLARAWHAAPPDADILRAALILCADHELNVSSFTARCVASAGAHPYAVVTAGLAALEGPRHGGATARVEAMLSALRRARSLPSAVAARLRRGDTVDGFGHPLYPAGDPRAMALLGFLRERYPADREYRFVAACAEAIGSATDDRPNLDFALAATTRVLRLPEGSPLALFAIGRSIGWIGHAIEQYAIGQLIRPRAKYVGVVPSDPGMPRGD
jgi:citrate synthase